MSRGQVKAEGRERRAPIIPATLRTLAADLRAGADVQALLGGLARALAAVPPLRGFTVVAAEGEPTFEADRLSIPLLGSGGSLGTMKLAPGGSGTFRTSRMHLAGALADIAAVVVEHALVARTRAAPIEIISVALGDLPVGVLCFDASGTLVFANPAAHQAVGGRVPMDWAGLWSALAPAGRRDPGTSFVLRAGSRLIHVTARRPSPAGPGAVVLNDLAGRVNAFSEVLSGEVYRNLVEKGPLILGIVAGPEGSPAAVEALEAARGNLPVGARVGPIDAEAAAVLVAGSAASSLWPVLRNIARAAGNAEPLRGGVASLRLEGDTPGAFLARATAGMRALSVEDRPGVLVCDRSSAVNDAISLILRRDFTITCSTRWDDTLVLLQEQAFDGLVLEFPARGDAPALDFAQRAVDMQPSARPFFVTDAPGPWDPADLGRPGAHVFRKPFVVREVRAAFKAAFVGGAS